MGSCITNKINFTFPLAIIALLFLLAGEADTGEAFLDWLIEVKLN